MDKRSRGSSSYEGADIKEMLSIYRNMIKEVATLEAMFPDRHFSLDGHIVGSIGEVAASYYYGIKLAKSSKKAIDGMVNERSVQIKVIQQDNVMLSYDGIDSAPDYLLVLYLNKNGILFEAYNGPWNTVFEAVSSKDSHGYKHVSINRLMELNKDVTSIEAIPQNVPVHKMHPSFKNDIKNTSLYKKIYQLSVKNIALFSDPNSTEDQMMESFPDDCNSFGFIMDCGHIFEELYGKEAFYNAETFKKTLKDVPDPVILGSAIFSKWRYYTHWCDYEKITDKEVRDLFVASFDRINELTKPKITN